MLTIMKPSFDNRRVQDLPYEKWGRFDYKARAVVWVIDPAI